MSFSTIAVKLRFVMLKTNKKDKIEDQKNLLATLLFFKLLQIIYAMLLAHTILHKLKLHQQSTVYKREFSDIYGWSYRLLDNGLRMTTCHDLSYF